MRIRKFEESNYKGIHLNGKTIRIALDPTKPITELEYPEFYDVKINSKCFGKCSYCLTEDSLISTKDGNKKISDININDNVYTLNQKTGELEINLVEQIHNRQYQGDIIEIELENGLILKITPNHKIYTKNRGWIEAISLNENDILLEI